ncbi:MAG: RluA family pseudouridine synthase [Firmicutes bacterium]|nr:RluA family pseudouridine synthase [Bacillota bacterium]
MQEEKEVKIVYEDNHVIVVIKPQNIPSQEDESGDKDMLNVVKEYIKVKYNKPGNVYVGLVHRLDRPTGGLMVFAKTSKAASRLAEQMKDGRFSKRYLTVLEGVPTDRRKKQINYLKKDEKNNIVKIVPMGEEGAKRAELIYNIVDVENNLSLAEIELLTGRSHQIRVQMSSLRTPVFGDIKYGAKRGIIAQDGEVKTNNLALWAYKLTFEHPTTKDVMTFKCYPDLESEPWKQFNIERLV